MTRARCESLRLALLASDRAKRASRQLTRACISGTLLAQAAPMSKHKFGSASPRVHRDERAGGAVTTSPTTKIAERDDGVVANPSIDASGQREGLHVHPVIGPGKRRSKG
jgi:hypothetical protein